MQGTRKQSVPNFPKSEYFWTPNMHTYVRKSGVRNFLFSGNLPYFVFLLPPFWDSLFCLITNKLVSLLLCFIICTWLYQHEKRINCSKYLESQFKVLNKKRNHLKPSETILNNLKPFIILTKPLDTTHF